MQAKFIATTPRDSLQAMRYQGLTVSENYAQLQSMLHRRLTPQHALLFAEPAPDKAGTSLDWYTSLEGRLSALADLPPAEQQSLLQEIRRLAGDIHALAEELKQGDENSQKMRGHMLSLALNYPGQEYIYAVDKQPLLLCWGFTAASLGARPEELMRLGCAAPLLASSEQGAAPADAGPAKAAGWLRLLLSLVCGLLLSLGLFFLAGVLLGHSDRYMPEMPWSNGTRGKSGGSGACARQTPAALAPELLSSLTAEQEKERLLRQQLDDLRRQYDQRFAECPRYTEKAAPEEKAEAPRTEEALPPADPPVLADIMPTTPDSPSVPDAPPLPKKIPPAKEPPAPPKAPPEPKRVAKGDTLEIPEGAREKNDLSFLEGCWLCETGLYSSRTNEPVTVRYCFGADGQGSRSVREQASGGTCQGPVRAQFDSTGKLDIRSEAARCSTRGTYVPQTVQCEQQGKKASCFGREHSPRGNRWRATFRRT